MEDFAQDYLGLSGTDSDLYYESYYKLNDETGDGYDDEEYSRQDELYLNQAAIAARRHPQSGDELLLAFM